MPNQPNDRPPADETADRADPLDDQLSDQLEALHRAIAGDGTITDSGSIFPTGTSAPRGMDSEEGPSIDRDTLAKLTAEVPGGKALELIERVRSAEREKIRAASETKEDGGCAGSTHRSDFGTDPAPVAGDDPPTDQLPLAIGRFQIRRQLGQGGFGLVLLAFDPRLDREVALKIPQFQSLANADTRARFLREGRSAASLNHVNIAAVHEAGNIGTISYIASAYCAGGSLADQLHRRQSGTTAAGSFKSVAELIAVLADAVEHAHARGIVHRDLKPSNILFEYELDPDHAEDEIARAARIVDFGLAKTLSSEADQTRSGAMLGTLGYMSPEQAAGDRDLIGPATDIYSLGAILYELLTGNPPLRTSSDLETMLAIQHDEPVPPRKLRPDCPADLQAICLKCLEKSPAARYRSATELANDLRRFRAGESVAARPITSHEKLVRWCRRNPTIASLSAAVVLLAIGASIAAIALAQSRSEALRHLQAANAAKIDSMRKALAANTAHAHSVRRTGTSGQRTESLRAISAAMENADDLNISQAQRRKLRNEAIASLSLVDLVIDRQWPAGTNEDSYPATDFDCRRYVRVEGSALAICDLDNNRVEHRFQLDEPTDRFVGFRFSPDGRYFAARYEQSFSRERLHLWSLETGESFGSIEAGGFGNGSGFSHDGEQLVCAGRLNRQVIVYDLPSLQPARSLPLPGQPETLACHPSQPYFACFVRPDRIEIRELHSGKRVRALQVDSYAYALGWSPDGRFIASGSRDGTVAVYDGGITERTDPLLPIWKNEGHAVMAVHLGWHPDSTMLGTSSMEGVTRLWDADSGTPLIAADGLMTCFSRDGRSLGTKGGRWRIAGGQEHQIAAQPEFETSPLLRFGLFNRDDVTSQINHWDAFPRGRLLVGQNYSGCVIRDVARDQPLAELQLDAGCLRFSPAGDFMIAYTISQGLHRLPVEVHEDTDQIEVSIGPPQKIMKQRPGFLAVGPNETILFQPFFGQSVLIGMGAPPTTTPLKPMHRSVMYGDIARDGSFVASATFKGKDVQIHQTDSGELVHTLPTGAACPWFSDDNRILAVAEIGRYSFWEVGSWRLLYEVDVVTRGIWPGSLAFTSDSQVVAIEDGSTIRLLDTKLFESFAAFTIPAGEIAESIRFTPDGRYLVVGGADQNPTHLWDLFRIRQRLDQLGLQWEPAIGNSATPRPNDQLDSDKPIRLTLELGELTQSIRPR